MAHKARTLLVVLAIAVGIAGAGTILTAWALVEEATTGGYRASDPAAASLRTDSVDASLLDAVRRVPGVRDADARRSAMVSLLVGGTWQRALLFAAPDLAGTRIGKLRRESGSWPPREGEIVVERSSVAFSGIGVGDHVLARAADVEPTPIAVGGIVRDVGLAPGWMEHVIYGFVTPATLAQLGIPSSLNTLRIVVTSPSATQDDVRRIAADVKRVIERTGRRVSDVDVPVPGQHIHAAQMDSLLYTQGAFGLLALVVCGFLVVNLITAMLAGQVREIAVMKTLGAEPAQLARMYLGFAAALGAAASLAALPVTLVVGRAYAGFRAELLNFDITGYDVPWYVISLEIAVGILVPVVAAWIPVRRSCRLPVATALRDFGIDRSADAFAEHWSARVGGASRPVILSVRNAFRNRQRMTLTLLALATGGAVFLAAANLRASVLQSVDQLFSAQRYDFAVTLAERHAVDSLDAVVARVVGVSAAESWTGLSAAVVRADSSSGNAFAISAPPANTRLFAPRIEAGRWLRPGDRNVVVVSRSLIKNEPTLRLGAHANLTIDGRTAPWTVIGVVDAGPQPAAYTSREIAAAYRGAATAGTIVAASGVAGAGARADLIQRLRAELTASGMAVSSSQLLEENRRVLEDHLLMVVDFLAVMGWVMILVGGMGLASTMSVAVLERTREIGVMRAIGARQRAILGMIQVEGLVIAIAGWLVALPLSVPISAALAQVFSRVMLEVPVRYVPELRGAVAWLGLVVAIAVLSCAWPAWAAIRVPVREALAYE